MQPLLRLGPVRRLSCDPALVPLRESPGVVPGVQLTRNTGPLTAGRLSLPCKNAVIAESRARSYLRMPVEHVALQQEDALCHAVSNPT